MLIGMIWAEAHDHAIAKGLRLPWNIPEDHRFFMETVKGRPIFMGRRSWQSMRARPLPGSLNIVITGQQDFEAPGATVVHSFPEALELAMSTGTDLAWAGGGAGIYTETQPIADVMVRTLIDADVDADVFVPELDARWHRVAAYPKGAEWNVSTAGFRYRYEVRAREGVKLPNHLLADQPDAHLTIPAPWLAY